MLQELIAIICEYVEAEPDEITMESSLKNDIGATSFDLMNIGTAIEEKYQVKVTNKTFLKVKTVGDMVRFLEETTV